MDEPPVIDVYPDMTLPATDFKKNQIAKFQGFFCDCFSRSGKLFSGSWRFFIEYITKDDMYKPGAVDADFTEATPFIRCVFPSRIVFRHGNLLAGLASGFTEGSGV